MGEHDIQDHLQPAKLTPSYHGRECLGNGEWPGYECQCDECEHYLTCFPDWCVRKLSDDELEHLIQGDFDDTAPLEVEQVMEITAEMVRRDPIHYKSKKTPEESWADFLKYYEAVEGKPFYPVYD